jgi:hypothetical protein
MRFVSLVGAGVVVGCALLAGCNCSGGEDQPPGAEAASGGEDARGARVLEGTVRLAEGAELPSYPDNPLVPPPNRPDVPEACTPPQRADAQPVELGADRGLAGVLVALHEFSTSPPHEPVTHEMTITDCRLEPRLVVATRGDRLRITNETDYPFLPDLGSGLMQAILHEGTQEIELAQGGVRRLECGFAAPCGRAEIVTLYHPLHAVTDEAGRFRIEGVPADEEVRVSAWHPLFRESNRTITLGSDASDSVELVLEPAPAPPAPEPAPEREGPAEDDPSELF